MEKHRYLDECLSEKELDAYLHISSAGDTNIYYLTGFTAPDSFIYLRMNQESTLLVSLLEYGRAKKEADIDEVKKTTEYIPGDQRGKPDAEVKALKAFLKEKEIENLGVPRRFPLYTADKLRETEYKVDPIKDKISKARQMKSSDEIGYIETAQRATEKAMKKAETLLRETEIQEDSLIHGDEPLTAEKVKTEIEIELLRNQCKPKESIVACGERSADPHWRGKGVLRPNTPIIIDIFPMHESMYHADMTRTFCVGEPSNDVSEMYQATREAKQAAFDVLSNGAGVTGDEVHEAVCDYFDEKGYGTPRDDTGSGFIHSTGHGVGLDLHEDPRLGDGGEELREGVVVTVEPGLYDEDIGGVRVEDLVVLTENGYRNLTEFPEELMV